MKKNKSLMALIIFDMYLIITYILLVGGLTSYGLYYEEEESLSEIIAVLYAYRYINFLLIPIGLFLTVWAFFSKRNKEYRTILLLFIFLLSMLTIMILFLFL